MLPNLNRLFTQRAIATAIAVIFFGQNILFAGKTESSLWDQRRKAAQAQQQNDENFVEQANDPATLLASLPKVTSDLSLPFSNKALSDMGINTDMQRDKKAALASAVVPDWMQTALAPYATIHQINLSKTPHAKTVLLLQDAHMHFEAQTNIAGTIDALGRALEKNKSQLLVGLEGADVVKADYAGYNDIPYRKELRQVAETFLRLNILNGTEFAAIGYLGHKESGPVTPPFTITGVENMTEYDANVKALKESVALRKKAEEALFDFSRALTDLKQKHYGKDMAAFDAKMAAFEEGKIGVPEYALYMDAIEDASSRNVRKLIEAALMEGSINFQKVESERTKILEILVAKMSEKEIQSLLQYSTLFRSGEISYAGYYEHLKKVAAKHGVAFSKYPEMSLYVQYVLKTEDIDSNQLLEEIKALELKVEKKLAAGREEREIASLSKDYFLLKKLTSHMLIENEWLALDSRRGEIAAIGDRFAALKAEAPASVKKMDGNWSVFEDFYRAAMSRNKFMVENMARRLEASNLQYGVLVAGGFHTQGLAEEFKAKGLTTLVVSPKITQIEEGGLSSLDVLASGRTPLDEMFGGDRLFLAVAAQSLGLRAKSIWALQKAATEALATGTSEVLLKEGTVGARVLADGEEPVLGEVRLGDSNIALRLEKNESPIPVLNSLSGINPFAVVLKRITETGNVTTLINSLGNLANDPNFGFKDLVKKMIDSLSRIKTVDVDKEKDTLLREIATVALTQIQPFTNLIDVFIDAAGLRIAPREKKEQAEADRDYMDAVWSLRRVAGRFLLGNVRLRIVERVDAGSPAIDGLNFADGTSLTLTISRDKIQALRNRAPNRPAELEAALDALFLHEFGHFIGLSDAQLTALGLDENAVNQTTAFDLDAKIKQMYASVTRVAPAKRGYFSERVRPLTEPLDNGYFSRYEYVQSGSIDIAQIDFYAPNEMVVAGYVHDYGNVAVLNQVDPLTGQNTPAYRPSQILPEGKIQSIQIVNGMMIVAMAKDHQRGNNAVYIYPINNEGGVLSFGQPTTVLDLGSRPISSVRVSPDGKWLVALVYSGQVPGITGDMKDTVSPVLYELRRVDGKMRAIQQESARRNGEPIRLLHEIQGPHASASRVTFPAKAQDAPVIMIQTSNEGAALFQIQSNRSGSRFELIAEPQVSSPDFFGADISPDGRYLASATMLASQQGTFKPAEPGRVYIYEILRDATGRVTGLRQIGQIVGRQVYGPNVIDVRFSPDGQMLVVSSSLAINYFSFGVQNGQALTELRSQRVDTNPLWHRPLRNPGDSMGFDGGNNLHIHPVAGYQNQIVVQPAINASKSKSEVVAQISKIRLRIIGATIGALLLAYGLTVFFAGTWFTASQTGLLIAAFFLSLTLPGEEWGHGISARIFGGFGKLTNNGSFLGRLANMLGFNYVGGALETPLDEGKLTPRQLRTVLASGQIVTLVLSLIGLMTAAILNFNSGTMGAFASTMLIFAAVLYAILISFANAEGRQWILGDPLKERALYYAGISSLDNESPADVLRFFEDMVSSNMVSRSAQAGSAASDPEEPTFAVQISNGKVVGIYLGSYRYNTGGAIRTYYGYSVDVDQNGVLSFKSNGWMGTAALYAAPGFRYYKVDGKAGQYLQRIYPSGQVASSNDPGLTPRSNDYFISFVVTGAIAIAGAVAAFFGGYGFFLFTLFFGIAALVYNRQLPIRIIQWNPFAGLGAFWLYSNFMLSQASAFAFAWRQALHAQRPAPEGSVNLSKLLFSAPVPGTNLPVARLIYPSLWSLTELEEVERLVGEAATYRRSNSQFAGVALAVRVQNGRIVEIYVSNEDSAFGVNGHSFTVLRVGYDARNRPSLESLGTSSRNEKELQNDAGLISFGIDRVNKTFTRVVPVGSDISQRPSVPSLGSAVNRPLALIATTLGLGGIVVLAAAIFYGTYALLAPAVVLVALMFLLGVKAGIQAPTAQSPPITVQQPVSNAQPLQPGQPARTGTGGPSTLAPDAQSAQSAAVFDVDLANRVVAQLKALRNNQLLRRVLIVTGLSLIVFVGAYLLITLLVSLRPVLQSSPAAQAIMGTAAYVALAIGVGSLAIAVLLGFLFVLFKYAPRAWNSIPQAGAVGAWLGTNWRILTGVALVVAGMIAFNVVGLALAAVGGLILIISRVSLRVTVRAGLTDVRAAYANPAALRAAKTTLGIPLSDDITPASLQSQLTGMSVVSVWRLSTVMMNSGVFSRSLVYKVKLADGKFVDVLVNLEDDVVVSAGVATGGASNSFSTEFNQVPAAVVSLLYTSAEGARRKTGIGFTKPEDDLIAARPWLENDDDAEALETALNANPNAKKFYEAVKAKKGGDLALAGVFKIRENSNASALCGFGDTTILRITRDPDYLQTFVHELVHAWVDTMDDEDDVIAKAVSFAERYHDGALEALARSYGDDGNLGEEFLAFSIGALLAGDWNSVYSAWALDDGDYDFFRSLGFPLPTLAELRAAPAPSSGSTLRRDVMRVSGIAFLAFLAVVAVYFGLKLELIPISFLGRLSLGVAVFAFSILVTRMIRDVAPEVREFLWNDGLYRTFIGALKYGGIMLGVAGLSTLFPLFLAGGKGMAAMFWFVLAVFAVSIVLFGFLMSVIGFMQAMGEEIHDRVAGTAVARAWKPVVRVLTVAAAAAVVVIFFGTSPALVWLVALSAVVSLLSEYTITKFLARDELRPEVSGSAGAGLLILLPAIAFLLGGTPLAPIIVVFGIMAAPLFLEALIRENMSAPVQIAASDPAATTADDDDDDTDTDGDVPAYRQLKGAALAAHLIIRGLVGLSIAIGVFILASASPSPKLAAVAVGLALMTGAFLFLASPAAELIARVLSFNGENADNSLNNPLIGQAAYLITAIAGIILMAFMGLLPSPLTGPLIILGFAVALAATFINYDVIRGTPAKMAFIMGGLSFVAGLFMLLKSGPVGLALIAFGAVYIATKIVALREAGLAQEAADNEAAEEENDDDKKPAPAVVPPPLPVGADDEDQEEDKEAETPAPAQPVLSDDEKGDIERLLNSAQTLYEELKAGAAKQVINVKSLGNPEYLFTVSLALALLAGDGEKSAKRAKGIADQINNRRKGTLVYPLFYAAGLLSDETDEKPQSIAEVLGHGVESGHPYAPMSAALNKANSIMKVLAITAFLLAHRRNAEVIKNATADELLSEVDFLDPAGSEFISDTEPLVNAALDLSLGEATLQQSLIESSKPVTPTNARPESGATDTTAPDLTPPADDDQAIAFFDNGVQSLLDAILFVQGRLSPQSIEDLQNLLTGKVSPQVLANVKAVLAHALTSLQNRRALIISVANALNPAVNTALIIALMGKAGLTISDENLNDNPVVRGLNVNRANVVLKIGQGADIKNFAVVTDEDGNVTILTTQATLDDLADKFVARGLFADRAAALAAVKNLIIFHEIAEKVLGISHDDLFAANFGARFDNARGEFIVSPGLASADQLSVENMIAFVSAKLGTATKAPAQASRKAAMEALSVVEILAPAQKVLEAEYGARENRPERVELNYTATQRAAFDGKGNPMAGTLEAVDEQRPDVGSALEVIESLSREGSDYKHEKGGLKGAMQGRTNDPVVIHPSASVLDVYEVVKALRGDDQNKPVSLPGLMMPDVWQAKLDAARQSGDPEQLAAVAALERNFQLIMMDGYKDPNVISDDTGVVSANALLWLLKKYSPSDDVTKFSIVSKYAITFDNPSLLADFAYSIIVSVDVRVQSLDGRMITEQIVYIQA